MQLRLEAFNNSELEKIHRATLEVLEKTGVKTGSEKVRDLLKEKGADVEGDIVKFPSAMVEKAIGKINKTVTLAARDPRYTVTLPAKNTIHSTSGYSAFTYDMESSKKRPSNSADLVDYAVLADALDEIGIFWPIVMPTEIEPESLQELSALDISFRNCTKHVQCSVADPDTAARQVKLAAVLAGGQDKLRENPLFSVVASPFTPLKFEDGTAEAYLIMARAGIPVVPMNVPLAGTTAPASMAGAIVVTNAEQLAVLIILKCADESAPMVYSSDTGTADMTSGDINYDTPDRPILCAAMAQVARFYNIPSCVSHDSCEDKPYKIRQGFERNALRIAMNMMDHSDLAIWLGSLDNALSASMWDMLLDSEAAKLANEYNRWFDVDDKTLAVGPINEEGPGGNFLLNDHTVENYRDTISLYKYQNNLLNYESEGSEDDFVEKAKARVREILASHKPIAIPDDKLKAMDEIMDEARRSING